MKINRTFRSVGVFVVFVALVAFVAIGLLIDNGLPPNSRVLVVANYVEIEPHRLMRNGFVSTVDAYVKGSGKRLVIKEFNAQGSIQLASQIADQVVTEHPDITFVMGTPLAQAIQKKDASLLIAQGAATNPVEAGLADSWSSSGRNYVATSDLPSVSSIFNMIQAVMPDAKKIGIIYNPGEINSTFVISEMRSYLKHNPRYSLYERSVSQSTDVSLALNSLFGQVDVLFIPPDNTVYSAISVVGQLASERGLPFFATTSDAIESGALASLEFNYELLGIEAAKLVIRVLEGESPGGLPIAKYASDRFLLNRDAATKLQIDLGSVSSHQQMRIVN